jgi:hypothetical protein
MKRNTLTSIFALSIILLGSCAKYDINPTPDDFQVTTDKLEYKVNDKIYFNFNSGPDMIVFYSGEPGKRYENRERSLLAGIPKLVFQTSMQQGLIPNNDSLQLLISTNLKNYDSAGVLAAKWTDISSKNTKWPTALATSYTTSDTIALTEFNSEAQVNIAFRAIGKKYATAAQRKWQVQNLNLSNFSDDGTVTPLFSTFANTGWVQVSTKNNSTPGFMAWNVGTWNQSTLTSVNNSSGIAIKSAYPIQFDPSANTNVDDNEDWLITAPINLKTVKPDAGVTIKNELSAAFAGMNYIFYKTPGIYAQYVYSFKTPGVYNVTFVGANVNNTNNSAVIRQMKITITL